MNEDLVHSLQQEEARIQEAYTRRQDGGRYSWFNSGHRLMMHDLENRMISVLSRLGMTHLNSKRILEVGCGTGFWIREFIRWGARPENLFGIDVIPDRIAEARELCPSTVTLEKRNATETGFPDNSFDIVLQSTVFTSVLDEGLRRRIGAEMLRVTKKDGLILWYDYFLNNPRNPDVRAVRKNEIHRIFPNCQIRLKRVTLLPPLARFLAPWAPWACRLLESIPFFCSHYLGVIKRNSFSS